MRGLYQFQSRKINFGRHTVSKKVTAGLSTPTRKPPQARILLPPLPPAARGRGGGQAASCL